MLRAPALAPAGRSRSPDAGIRAEPGRYTRRVDFINLPLLAASALVFASVLTGLLSARIGFSFLLVFLLAGILAGEDGIGGYHFDDFRLSFWVGNLALAVILLDGGLRTAYATFRTGLRPAALLNRAPGGDGRQKFERRTSGCAALNGKGGACEPAEVSDEPRLDEPGWPGFRRRLSGGAGLCDLH